jgi:uncharacterized membrane protein YkvA (DUF1232 family)
MDDSWSKGEIKLKKFFKRMKFVFKVKKFLPFLIEFFTSRTVSFKKKAVSIGLMIGYFLIPFDLIPDFLTLIGVVDDVGIMLIILQQIIKMAPEELKSKYNLRD